MNHKFTGREFVKLSSGAAVSIVPKRAAGASPPGWQGTERVERVATCEMSFWRCGALAEVADGRVVRIEGNPDHPLTNGCFCARGYAGTRRHRGALPLRLFCLRFHLQPRPQLSRKLSRKSSSWGKDAPEL